MSKAARKSAAIARAQRKDAPTPRQVAFLKTLCLELKMEYPRGLSKAEASDEIRTLQYIRDVHELNRTYVPGKPL